jgi:hypothetical protein
MSQFVGVTGALQASERWQNVRMSEVELAMLTQLRCELGLEPPAIPGRPAKHCRVV